MATNRTISAAGPVLTHKSQHPMDQIFLASFLSFAAILLTFSLSFFALIRTKKSPDSNCHNLPPGSFGWPIIGETIDFLFGKPEKFVGERMKKYSSDIFKTKILGEKTAVFCGPNGHKFIFSNEQKLFTSFRPHPIQKLFRSYQTTKSPPPPPSQTPNGEAKFIRQPGFFKPEALARFLGKMDSISQQYIHKHLVGKDEIKAYPLAKNVTLTISCRFFLGIDNPERISRFVDKFDDITLGMHSIIMNIPGTIFYRANKAAAAVRKELVNVIKEKKMAMKNGTIMQDLLSHLIVATDPTGKSLPENEIADKIMGLIVAGYSTVATAIAFVIKYVGERPEIYHRIRAGNYPR